jgi:hypothetical protein
MSYQGTRVPEATFRRRATKFTPERIQQIRDLIAHGETCEAIAARIGVTVGTLKVSCSRLGISLRRPRVKLLHPAKNKRASTAGSAEAIFTIRMQYNGKEQDTALPLTPEMIGQLALEASARDQKIGELAKDLLEGVTNKGLFEEVLGD